MSREGTDVLVIDAPAAVSIGANCEITPLEFRDVWRAKARGIGDVEKFRSKGQYRIALYSKVFEIEASNWRYASDCSVFALTWP